MKATYYHCGVSGDASLTYKTYQITIANYSYYLNHGSTTSGGYIKGKTNCSYISPKESSELFDYRVSVTMGGQKVTLSRDGYYVYDSILEDLTITAVEGFIDVYPGRII